jgi:hypothetical protein
MKKLIFDLFGLSFSVAMLYTVYKEGMTTENNLVFAFTLFFLASLTYLVMIADTISKLLSK